MSLFVIFFVGRQFYWKETLTRTSFSLTGINLNEVNFMSMVQLSFSWLILLFLTPRNVITWSVFETCSKNMSMTKGASSQSDPCQSIFVEMHMSLQRIVTFHAPKRAINYSISFQSTSTDTYEIVRTIKGTSSDI